MVEVASFGWDDFRKKSSWRSRNDNKFKDVKAILKVIRLFDGFKTLTISVSLYNKDG